MHFAWTKILSRKENNISHFCFYEPKSEQQIFYCVWNAIDWWNMIFFSCLSTKNFKLHLRDIWQAMAELWLSYTKIRSRFAVKFESIWLGRTKLSDRSSPGLALILLANLNQLLPFSSLYFNSSRANLAWSLNKSRTFYHFKNK